MSRHILAQLALVAVLSSLACRGSDPATDGPGPDPTDTGSTGTEPTGSLVRPVVLADSPVALANPQQDVVTWPLWGGAFTVEQPVSVQVALEAGAAGASGLLIAGPGSLRDRVGVELVSVDGAWTLRETVGGEIVQELPLAGDGRFSTTPSNGEFLLELGATGTPVDVIGAEGEASLALTTPLATGPDAVGLYVTLDPGAELTLGEVSLSQPLPVSASLGTPLRELALAHGLDVGSATDIWPPLHDLGFESMFAEQFGAASPTEFYWPTTRGEDEDWFFVPADLMVNYATVHDQTLTGMFLVWDFALPGWVRDLDGDSAALGAVYDEHVTTLVERYRGRVDAWVVVNEAIWGPGEGGPRAQYAQTLWYDTLGEEHIERAFTLARAADPDAVLMYNETGAEAVNGKSDFLYDMVTDFVAREVPIDAVGLQFHVHAGSPPDMASVQANFERIGALGLDVYITELDVSLESVPGTEAERQDLQAAIYVDVLETCLAVPACKSWTVFGFSDRYAWDELGDATPLLFDESYVAKPAYFAVQAALE